MSPFLIEQLAKVHDERHRYEQLWRRVRHTRALIFLALKQRFQRRISRDLAHAVARLTDLHELERWSVAAATADDTEAFRAEIARPHQTKYLGRRCAP